MRKHRQEKKKSINEKQVKEKVDETKEIVPPVPPVPPIPPIPPIVVEKKKYAGIGLVGNHATISKFRGLVKYHGKMIGEEIITCLEEWIMKNPM